MTRDIVDGICKPVCFQKTVRPHRMSYVLLAILISATVSCQVCPFQGLTRFGPVTPPTPMASTPDILVSGDQQGGPPGCTALGVAHRLSALLDAINQGDPNVVKTFFQGENAFNFEWYSMTAVRNNGPEGVVTNHFVAYHLDDLAAYFTRRFQAHEHFHLNAIQVNNWQGTLVNFGPVEFTRSADDLAPDGHPSTYNGSGKGAMDCVAQTFAVLSLVTEVP